MMISDSPISLLRVTMILSCYAILEIDEATAINSLLFCKCIIKDSAKSESNGIEVLFHNYQRDNTNVLLLNILRTTRILELTNSSIL